MSGRRARGVGSWPSRDAEQLRVGRPSPSREDEHRFAVAAAIETDSGSDPDPRPQSHAADAGSDTNAMLASPCAVEQSLAELVERASQQNWRLNIDLSREMGNKSSVCIDHDGLHVTVLLTTESHSVYDAWQAALVLLRRELQRRSTLPFSLRLEFSGDWPVEWAHERRGEAAGAVDAE